MTKIFGTDGIRGTANIYPMTSEVALALGRAIAYGARRRTKRPRIIVGKDTRLSCYMLEMALISGICSMGADALMTGPIPTAGIAYLTKDLRCDAGIMITASHNPYTDNGIKIFGADGFKLTEQEEKELETYILSHRTTEQFISTDDDLYPKEDKIGKTFKMEDACGRYITHLKTAFPSHLDLCGVRIAIDCANGAAYKVAPSVFKELGAEVVVIGNEPNGTNINDFCGALHPMNLQSLIRAGTWEHDQTKYFDIGFAFDGDADRLVVVDETGTVVDGDVILALALAEQQHSSCLQIKPDIVTTTMSNMALHEFVKALGGEITITDVGDKYVLEKMREKGIRIGGEQSGHIIHLNHSTTGDGIVAALKLLGYIRDWNKRAEQCEALKKYNGPMSEYARVIQLYPQKLINIDVKEKIPLESVDGLTELIDEIKEKLQDTGRILVRYSGTENKLRIMVEAKEEDLADKYSNQIAKLAKKKLSIQ